jgi:hypothetical protein
MSPPGPCSPSCQAPAIAALSAAGRGLPMKIWASILLALLLGACSLVDPAHDAKKVCEAVLYPKLKAPST